MLVWSVGWMCFCYYYQNALLSICIDYMLSIDVMYCRVVYTVHKVAAHCVCSAQQLHTMLGVLIGISVINVMLEGNQIIIFVFMAVRCLDRFG